VGCGYGHKVSPKNKMLNSLYRTAGKQSCIEKRKNKNKTSTMR
jgi:hypothetical protein